MKYITINDNIITYYRNDLAVSLNNLFQTYSTETDDYEKDLIYL